MSAKQLWLLFFGSAVAYVVTSNPLIFLTTALVGFAAVALTIWRCLTGIGKTSMQHRSTSASESIVCPNCRYGQVLYYYKDLMGHKAEGKKPCPNCHGTGRIRG